MINTTLFEFSFYVYVLALIFSIAVLVNRKPVVGRMAFGLFLTGFALHTVALFVRWGEAGGVEVAAFQEAEGRILQGWEWFEVWISHPPWSNLYESLVCFGWGVVLVSLYAIRKFHIPILPVFAIGLTLLVMGVASLLVNQEITPLVPALQSKWIHLHVTMATICYPAFGLAAFLGLFYLLKTGVPSEKFGLIIALTAILIVLSVGGRPLLERGDYEITALADHMGKSFPVTYYAEDAGGNVLAKDNRFRLPIPFAGPALYVSILGFLLASILYFTGASAKKPAMRKGFSLSMTVGFLGLSAAILAVVAGTVFSTPLELSAEQARALVEARHMAAGKTLVAAYQVHGQGAFRLSLSGNPFEFMLLVTAWLNLAFYFVMSWKREWLEAQLPSPERLDELSYKTILFAFPFLTLLIVTGAIWAYYAWGRYWGWDPKETWSLITWIVYSIYLHVRITHGWEGRLPAILATVGFGVVVFTYLGVNILLSGLHSYASG